MVTTTTPPKYVDVSHFVHSLTITQTSNGYNNNTPPPKYVDVSRFVQSYNNTDQQRLQQQHPTPQIRRRKSFCT